MGKLWKIAALAVVFAIVLRFFFASKTFDPSDVVGKRVLITGASSGIGEQLAYQYAQNGASVYITARREQLLEKVVQKCKDLGAEDAKFGFQTAEMSRQQEIANMLTSAVDFLGGLDVVIINHAYLVEMKNHDDLAEAMKTLQDCLIVNVEAPAYIAGLTLPYLHESHGSLAVVNSIAGKLASKYVRPYTTSKFALDGYFSSLRSELKGSNVSVTNIVLGAIETENARNILNRAAETINFPSEKVPTVGAEETARFILEGVTTKEREIYFPTYLNYVMFIREFIARYDLQPV